MPLSFPALSKDENRISPRGRLILKVFHNSHVITIEKPSAGAYKNLSARIPPRNRTNAIAGTREILNASKPKAKGDLLRMFLTTRKTTRRAMSNPIKAAGDVHSAAGIWL